MDVKEQPIVVSGAVAGAGESAPRGPKLNILYHHRTRATDAQRVHIRELVIAFRRLGHEVEIASLVDTESAQEAEKDVSRPFWKKLLPFIPFSNELMQLGYNLVGLPMLWKKLRGGGVRFVYERYALFNFSGVLAARLTRTPLVLEVNSPLALEMSREKTIRAVRFANWMERIICNSATRVIVISSPLRRILIENGVDPSRIVVMPNGVNLEHLHSEAASTELSQQLGVFGKVTIGFVGWFKKWHGLEFLVEAFHQSGLSKHGAVLLMIGDGPAMPDLKTYVAKHELSDSVVFSGAIAHESIAPYLDLIDIAVQPAANEYCCPMKVIEYLALSKPIVAPRQDNIVELMDDGKQGLLFTPLDKNALIRALETLVTDSAMRSRMGKEGLASIHRRGLLWTSNAQRVIDLVAGTQSKSQVH
jgi:glycosyltransferase involved in cell wall biosynthesis